MSLSYNDIFNAMKTAFYDECGQNAEDYGETAMKFKAVASEIFAVSSAMEYMFKQAFPQTASGENLDRLAVLRDIRRKSAQRAGGVLTFYLNDELEREAVIPKGTVCSLKGLPYIQFATDEAASIPAGSLEVSVRATAIKAGEEYNAPAGQVTVIVNPPSYVAGVKNERAFVGGCDDECDESLKERILSSYSAKNNGINARSIREMLLTIDEVLDAAVKLSDFGEMFVCLRTSDDGISPELEEKATELLGFPLLCGVPLCFVPAQAKLFNVSAEVTAISGADFEAIEHEVHLRLKNYCAKRKIGEDISVSALSLALCGIDGVKSFNLSLRAEYGTTNCGALEYLALNETAVAVHE